jgi:hypothetical protein
MLHTLNDLIDLEALDNAFHGTNFGEPINSSLDEKKEYTLKQLEQVLYGYYTGYTITQIMIEMKWLTPKGRKISRKGMEILRAKKREVNSKNAT